jgi:hypothetical protein
VPAPPSGAEVGQLTGATCTGEYGSQETQHQGISTSCDASTCACTMQMTCQASAYIYTGNSCNSGGTTISTQQLTYTFAHGQTQASSTTPGQCQFLFTSNFTSLAPSDPSTVGIKCNGGGSGTPTVSWSTNTNFCGAKRSSSSCAANQVCVAKPTSGGLCVRIPGSGAGCPVGYTTGSSGVYYASNTSPSCSCGCIANQNTSCTASGNLYSNWELYSDGSCGSGDYGGAIGGGFQCQTQYFAAGQMFTEYPISTIGNKIAGVRLTSTSGQNFGCTDNIANKVDAQPTTPSTICCQ